MTKEIVKLLANWFTLGNVRKAPGTIGTLGAIPLYLMINSLRNFFPSEKIYNSFYFLFLVVFFIFSVYICNRAEQEIYKKKDPQAVVIDEVLGFMTTMFLVNPNGIFQTIFVIALGFLLFRIFDITKIGYIDKVQKLKNGLGVVADDFLAGLVANLILVMISGLLWG